MTGIDQFRLDGRVALITGGTKGLGRAMAKGLLSAGANLVICSRHGEASEAAADQLSADSGRQVLGIRCDVSQEAQVQALVDQTITEMGKIDILIANAGINIRGPLEELPLDDFLEVMKINITGVWLCCRAVLPHMKAAKYGRIINVGSVLSSIGLAGRTPYAASKGAVAMLTRTLALECAEHGITVNTLCPGPFLTPMNEPIVNQSETNKSIIGAVPMKRWGQMDEIQGAAIFLASDASSYVTGTNLYVDGGWTAH